MLVHFLGENRVPAIPQCHFLRPQRRVERLGNLRVQCIEPESPCMIAISPYEIALETRG